MKLAVSSAPVTHVARPVVALGFAALFLSCSGGEPKAGLGPNEPNPITRLVVSPASATVATDAVLDFSVLATLKDGTTEVPPVAL